MSRQGQGRHGYADGGERYTPRGNDVALPSRSAHPADSTSALASTSTASSSRSSHYAPNSSRSSGPSDPTAREDGRRDRFSQSTSTSSAPAGHAYDKGRYAEAPSSTPTNPRRGSEDRGGSSRGGEAFSGDSGRRPTPRSSQFSQSNAPPSLDRRTAYADADRYRDLDPPISSGRAPASSGPKSSYQRVPLPSTSRAPLPIGFDAPNLRDVPSSQMARETKEPMRRESWTRKPTAEGTPVPVQSSSRQQNSNARPEPPNRPQSQTQPSTRRPSPPTPPRRTDRGFSPEDYVPSKRAPEPRRRRSASRSSVTSTPPRNRPSTTHRSRSPPRPGAGTPPRGRAVSRSPRSSPSNSSDSEDDGRRSRARKESGNSQQSDRKGGGSKSSRRKRRSDGDPRKRDRSPERGEGQRVDKKVRVDEVRQEVPPPRTVEPPRGGARGETIPSGPAAGWIPRGPAANNNNGNAYDRPTYPSSAPPPPHIQQQQHYLGPSMHGSAPTGPRALRNQYQPPPKPLLDSTPPIPKGPKSSELPTGPKAKPVVLKAMSKVSISTGTPTGPRIGAGNVQLKKFFPGDDDDEDAPKRSSKAQAGRDDGAGRSKGREEEKREKRRERTPERMDVDSKLDRGDLSVEQREAWARYDYEQEMMAADAARVEQEQRGRGGNYSNGRSQDDGRRGYDYAQRQDTRQQASSSYHDNRASYVDSRVPPSRPGQQDNYNSPAQSHQSRLAPGLDRSASSSSQLDQRSRSGQYASPVPGRVGDTSSYPSPGPASTFNGTLTPQGDASPRRQSASFPRDDPRGDQAERRLEPIAIVEDVVVVPTAPPTPALVPGSLELYERIVQVGEGTYGKVYKAKNVETGGLVALKRIRMEAEKDGFPVTAVREIKLLQSLRHPNVVDLIEMMVSRGHVYMVFEYMDHDLTGVLHHPSIHFTPAHLKSLMKQLLEGLGFIHRRGVLHRDLKGSNILLSKQGELKIADFGLARFYARGRNNDYTNRVITQWYKPPELLFGTTIYGSEVDMWSAGCIFLELFARRPVFQGQDEIDQLEVIFKVTGTPRVETWPTLLDLPWYELVKPKTVIESVLRETYSKWLTPAGLDLAETLLCLDPSRRPGSEEVLEMPYFSEDPLPELPDILSTVKGEWHEYESKRARKKARDEAS